jgi:hypothetical protein
MRGHTGTITIKATMNTTSGTNKIMDYLEDLNFLPDFGSVSLIFLIVSIQGFIG